MESTSDLFAPVDFDRFHEQRLPALVEAGNARLAAGAARSAPPLAFRGPSGNAFTYALEGDTVVVRPGSDGADAVVRISTRQWSDLVNQVRTIPNMVYSGELDLERGRPATVMAWELALLALIHARPTFDADAARPRDDAGTAIDLSSAFTLADPDAHIADFLGRTGFAVVRAVLGDDDIAGLRAAADAVAAAAGPGDRRSWWAHDAAGEQLLCRVTYANERSAPIAALSDDARIRRLGTLLGPDSVDTPDRMDGHSVIIKHAGAVDGLADLPWHVDCGMGGHAFMCPIVQISVFLERADADTGTLSVIPGSHRFATPVPGPGEEHAFGAVELQAEPGDCIVHLGDTMHAAKPPRATGPCRRSIVISFFQRRLLDIIGPGEAYNDVLLARDDGHVRHI